MGYVSCTAACIGCGIPFSFNPNKVPSVVVEGNREPICRSCVERANPIRKEKGLPVISILPGAYEAADESEIAW
jgi:hypothetical protein